MADIKYNRVILKLSGEALAGEKGFGINPPVLKDVAKELKEVHDLGVQIAIVVGGGNMWRGVTGEQLGMERAQADYIGMLATIMNALSLQDALESIDVQPGFRLPLKCDRLRAVHPTQAIRHLEKDRIVIFAGGTGSPYFSTDTTAALRAAEINADAILMGKNGVDGVYSADPNKDASAVKFDHLTHMDLIEKNLHVMDTTASSLSMDNHSIGCL
ncbi:MAG: UMP kinase [Limosilactobacillus pontis]